jgi:Transglycosylase SLT domain
VNRDELIALARQAAIAHQLPPETVCGICEQESSWRPWAIRYEQDFFARYVAPLFTNNKIVTLPGSGGSATEAYARGMSWGLMQVIGQTARESGFTGPFLSELCDPHVGLEFGCRVLASKLGRAHGDVAGALLLWNGGGNPNYPGEVLKLAEKYK